MRRFSFEPDSNEALGRGFKVGFLGQLHFEITSSRLQREYNLEFLTSFPSIAYRVQNKGEIFVIKQPQDFPDHPEKVWEPIVDLEILTPQQYLSRGRQHADDIRHRDHGSKEHRRESADRGEDAAPRTDPRF